MGDADAIKLVALLRDRQGRRTIESKVYMLRMGQAASGAPTHSFMSAIDSSDLRSSSRRVYKSQSPIRVHAVVEFFYIEH